jgi:predicted MFS family arabinose efflux permease
MVADVVDEENRSSVFAVFYTSINIAVVIGPLLGAIFYVNHRFELLLIAGIICVGLAAVLQKWIRETAPTYEHKESTTTKWYSFVGNQLRDYKIIVKDRTFLLFIVAGVLSAQTFMQLDLLIPVYTKEVVHNQTLLTLGSWSLTVSGEQAFGFILAENGLLVALLTVAITKWVIGFKERNVFIVSSLLYAIAIIGFGQTEWIWGLVLAMAIFTLGELLVAGLQQSFISKIAPDHMRGQYFAAASLRYTIGRTIAPISIPLTVWIGYEWTFFTIAVLAIGSALIYWIMFSRMEHKQQAFTDVKDLA